jgi:hypothetical protein
MHIGLCWESANEMKCWKDLEDNIEMDFRDIAGDDMGWIDLL